MDISNSRSMIALRKDRAVIHSDEKEAATQDSGNRTGFRKSLTWHFFRPFFFIELAVLRAWQTLLRGLMVTRVKTKFHKRPILTVFMSYIGLTVIWFVMVIVFVLLREAFWLNGEGSKSITTKTMGRDKLNNDADKQKLHNKTTTSPRPACGLGRMFDKSILKSIHFLPKSEAVYCQIDQVGASFWTKMIYAIEQNKTKLDVHDMMYLKSQSEFSLENFSLKEKYAIESADEINAMVKSSTKFLFVRDPYTKIFAAFIDKIFLLTLPEINQHIYVEKKQGLHNIDYKNDRSGLGLLNISFTDLLHYSMGYYLDLNLINKHFRPQSRQCDVCNIKYDFIGKLENFTNGTNDVIRRFKLPTKLNAKQARFFWAYFQSLEIKKTKTLTRELIRRTYYWSQFVQRDISVPFNECLLWELVLIRLWKSLHIKGFIDDSFGIPFKRGCDVTEEAFVKAANFAIDRTDESIAKAQRDKYLIQAFRTVPLETLKAFRAFVQGECDLFGYNCSHSEIFEGRENLDTVKNMFSDVKYTFRM